MAGEMCALTLVYLIVMGPGVAPRNDVGRMCPMCPGEGVPGGMVSRQQMSSSGNPPRHGTRDSESASVSVGSSSGRNRAANAEQAEDVIVREEERADPSLLKPYGGFIGHYGMKILPSTDAEDSLRNHRLRQETGYAKVPERNRPRPDGNKSEESNFIPRNAADSEDSRRPAVSYEQAMKNSQTLSPLHKAHSHGSPTGYIPSRPLSFTITLGNPNKTKDFNVISKDPQPTAAASVREQPSPETPSGTTDTPHGERDGNTTYRQGGDILSHFDKPDNTSTKLLNLNVYLKHGEKSEMMCAEYSSLVTEKRLVTSLLPHGDPIVVSVQKCELTNPLIVGGESALPGEFPHMAALGYRKEDRTEWMCGASLISDSFLLTAAHCTYSSWGPPVLARLGVVALVEDTQEQRPTDMKVAQILRHPDYEPPARYHDVALVQVQGRVPLGLHVRPACLATDTSETSDSVVATGWGKVATDGNTSNTLLKVQLQLVDLRHCSTYYAHDRHRLSRGITQAMLCAWSAGAGRDTCQGDSGGPLQMVRSSQPCVHRIMGITSFGKGCGIGVPGVYTRVSTYVPWIEQVVWP